MATLLSSILACAAALGLCIAELRRQLMMMQQNSYRADRYRRWMKASQDSTTVMRLVTGAVTLAAMSTLTVPVVAMALIAVTAITDTAALARRRYKKPLVMTRRAARIMGVSMLLAVAVAAGGALWGWHSGQWAQYAAVALMLVYCFSHQVILAAVWLLGPVERSINRGYYNDAARILASMPGLKVIGVTGSYGKTSTKHYLHRLLSESFDVAMTPGSFNTTLGVIRTVREHLKPYNEVFIVEMGAKQPGDIKEICDLVHPTVGIVTAVGAQHLESFGSVENVQRTKFELIDSLPAGGLAVVNDDFAMAASRPVDNVECLRYGITSPPAGGYTATDITYTPDGTDFTIVTPGGGKLAMHTPLVGECNVSNLLGAVIIALRLGVPAAKAAYAVSRMEQVEHRLSTRRTPGGVTVIDDAFNSNPSGSAMALDVLAMMKGGRRIVVTPGMIELGERQHELNRELGRKIAACADVAVVVGQYNREAITQGIEEGARELPSAIEVHTVDSFAASQALLAPMLRRGDTVLYENDLPDTFK